MDTMTATIDGANGKQYRVIAWTSWSATRDPLYIVQVDQARITRNREVLEHREYHDVPSAAADYVGTVHRIRDLYQ